MLIDTHCHLSFKAFENDYADVIQRAKDKDIQMITVGSNSETSEKAITIAKEDGVFACIGIHPTHASDEKFDKEWFLSQADNPKVVAIGECGIDHFHLDESRRDEILKDQEQLFIKHLEVAKEKNLPVVLHTRDGKTESTGTAYEHIYGIIKDFGYFNCVVHCFGGNWKYAEKFLDLGILISFTGIVTFKNASDDLLEVVKKVPIDKFMVETDAPYLSPEPHRGEQNEPAYVEHVAARIADLRKQSIDDIVNTTTKTAKKFFNI